MNTAPPGPVLVFGAGAIGCWLGGALRAAGVSVTFVGRPRVLGALRTHGLTLTDLDGGRRQVAGLDLDLAEAVGDAVQPALLLNVEEVGLEQEARAGHNGHDRDGRE